MVLIRNHFSLPVPNVQNVALVVIMIASMLKRQGHSCLIALLLLTFPLLRFLRQWKEFKRNRLLYLLDLTKFRIENIISSLSPMHSPKNVNYHLLRVFIFLEMNLKILKNVAMIMKLHSKTETT